jgi:shikimate kinase
MQRQLCAGKQHDLEREQRQQTVLHVTIIAFARALRLPVGRGIASMLLKLKRTPGIFLVGFMGCGKSTVGRALAGELGWSFFDLDDEIERREGLPIAEIFEMRGEAAFREVETAALRERITAVERGRPQVISLGGGTFLTPENFDLISNHGVTVWLDVPLEVIRRRIQGFDHRPLARDPEQLRELYEARRAGYARAEFHLEIASDDVVVNVAKIMSLPLF